MKKIILVAFLIFLFSFFVKDTFAQNTNGSFFDSKIVFSQKINPNTRQTFIVGPFTSIIIQPKTFKEEINFYVYKGILENIKAVLPKSQSPISSYYLYFVNSKNEPITPELPIIIHSYNNYIDSKTYFYPLVSSSKIDRENVKELPGPVKVIEQLSPEQLGFIVAVNKVLDKNDSSLLPATSAKDSKTALKTKIDYNSLILPFALLLVVIFALLVVLSFRKRNKKS